MTERAGSGRPGRTYVVTLDKAAQKALDRLPKKVVTHIAKVVDDLAHDPRPRGCVKLEGSDNDYLVRVGDYRILYTIYDERLVVLVIDVGPRKDIYRRRRK